ncbi:pentatricopeptide (PPR) repeat-containing protein [Wolffia australiana]
MRNVFARRTLQASYHFAKNSSTIVSSAAPHTHDQTLFSLSSLLQTLRRSYNTSQEIQTHLPKDLAIAVNVEEEAVHQGNEEIPEEEDEPMNEFLSRFTARMKNKLCDAFPDSSKETIDGMLLLIAQKVVSEMEKGGGVLSSAVSSDSSDPSLNLSPDLWSEVWEVSKKSFEETRRTRRREEMKRFLHCEDVKTMCRFASEVGIRGDMLRELRFKWANEKLEEFDFYRNLERMVEHHKRSGEVDSEAAVPSLAALLRRRGAMKYAVRGLNLSAPGWAAVADKINDAEKRNGAEEAQPIMGKCRLITEEIVGLKEDDDPFMILSEWVELLRPNRADWLALLARLHQQNLSVYFKVAELALNEKSFEASIGDYAKLMDAYAKANNVKKAEQVLERMTDRGVETDIRVWVILLQMYCDSVNLDRAKEAFEKLRNQGFQPDLNTYRSMIMAYVNSGLPKAAESLIREMEARDIKPTLELYRTLLQAFAQKGHVDSAQRMFNNMQFSGIQPDLEACTLLLEAYGQAGDADQARHSFDFLRKSGHKPDDRCVGSMMSAYQKKNLLDKALDLILSLEKDGFKPGMATYAVLVDWLGRLLLVEEVEQILEKITELGDVPFKVSVSLCSMYARAGTKEKALELLKVVEEKREQLTGEQFERVIDGLVAGGFHEDAKRVHGFMQSQGFSASESLRIALMAGPMVSRHRPGSPLK